MMQSMTSIKMTICYFLTAIIIAVERSLSIQLLRNLMDAFISTAISSSVGLLRFGKTRILADIAHILKYLTAFFLVPLVINVVRQLVR
jgi:hypothetical protein